jgi:predicted acyl esterase
MKTLHTLTAFALAATVVAAAPNTSLSDSASQSAQGGQALAAGQSYPAGDGPMGSGYFEEIEFASLDGTILHADVLLPGPPEDAPEGGWPMIISGGPYFSAPKAVPAYSPLAQGPVERFADFIVGADIFANGYGWAQFDTRGYGSSQGCNDLGGIGEQMDMAAGVEYFGEAPYSNGNVGTWGKSYDAWTQVQAMAMNPAHLKAAVVQAPLIEGYQFVWDNGVHFSATWYASPSLYLLYDEYPAGPADGSPAEQVNSAQSTASSSCWAESEVNHTAENNHDAPFWQERDLKPRASASQVPTFWTMGFQDTNTKPTNLMDVYGNLEGYNKGWFGHWDHVRGNEVNREDFFSEVMDFLDVNLKGNAEYALDVNKDEQVRVQTQLGDWYTADSYPASDVEMFELELNTGTYVDDVNNGETEGLWTFTDEFPAAAHFSGEPRFTVQASPQAPNANLLARVYDVGPSGRAELIARGAHLLRQDGTVGQGSSIVFDGWPSDFVIQQGHRIGVIFSSTDAQHSPVNTNGTVQITSAFVELPFRTAMSNYDEYTDLKAAPFFAQLDAGTFAANTQSNFVFPPSTN